MPAHNSTADIITCRKCGALTERTHDRRICRPCYRVDMARRGRESRARKREERQRQRAEYLASPEYAAKVRQWRKTGYARWLAKHPEHRAVQAVRERIRQCIKANNFTSAPRTSELIGYPVARLRAWARANGYGKGKHIDHIVPLSWWLKRYPDDFARAMRGAWHLGNLRVISAGENLRKNARREFLV